MPVPKELDKLFGEKDKAIIEALKKRLSDRLTKDPAACKKAALILENWLKQGPRKK